VLIKRLLPPILAAAIALPILTAALTLSIVVFAFSAPALAQDRDENLKGKLDPAKKTLILDGSSVHTAGNLQMNVTNFGFLGSLPKSRYPMSESPSAQWPAGSGIEYLYAAGIWIAAESDGVPSVSTGYPETEFYPGDTPIDVIYRSYEGAPGGSRYPSAPDDDQDGRVDEDPLNGRDDDYDGRIDEDYAAIGKLMYSCWFSDDQPIATEVWPEHLPLHVRVDQESHQWSEENFNDFVGVRYTISNQSSRYLSNLYVGLYADLDAGPRDRGAYYRDDMIGTWEGMRCGKIGAAGFPVRMKVVYVYDADGDDGKTPGYFGVVILGSRMYIPRALEPWETGLRSVSIFAGLLPYANGGEPVNDFQRYESMSKSWREPNTVTPNDYKVLISTGPFGYFLPGFTITLDVAYVCGEGLEGMLDNAAIAARVYNGIWYDMDRNNKTGVKGREGLVVGPVEQIDPDPCDAYVESLKLKKGDTLWCNLDCFEERTLWNFPDCYKGEMTFSMSQTGIEGKETRLNWITSTAPPPPLMRVIAGDNMATLFWDNTSEMTPDAVTMQYDFEGYKIFRAHDWHRPLGTTAATGPSSDLWYLIDGRDIVNGILPDAELKLPYEGGGFEYEPLHHIAERENILKAFEESVYHDPLGEVPCPPGLTEAECDTFEALARWNLGYEGGRRYYKYIDRDVKNGLPYFYAIVAYDHIYSKGTPLAIGLIDTPVANFVYVVPQSAAQPAASFEEKNVFVVPNPVTAENMAPWRLDPNDTDPSGEKAEFRNLPKCRSVVKIFTVAGDLVQTLRHDGSGGNGTLPWNLISRNGQTVTSGIYLFSVEPEDKRFTRVIGKFVVIQ